MADPAEPVARRWTSGGRRLAWSIVVVGVTAPAIEYAEIQNRRNGDIRRVDQVADAQVHRNARQRIGLLPRQALVRDQPIDHLQQRITGGEGHVFGKIRERADLGAVKVRMRWRDDASRL